MYALPGDTFTAVLQGAPTGLVGTLGVRIQNVDATNHTPRTTAGIVENPAGSGIYSKGDLVAPDDSGTYLVVWDDGTSYAGQELIVTHDIPDGISASPLLVDLEKYKLAIGETDDGNDVLHTQALQDASQAVLNFTDRDFASDLVTEVREYPIPDAGYILDIDDANEVLDVSGVGGVDWRAGTEGPAASAGVYTYIEFGAFNLSSLLMGFTRNEDRLGYRSYRTISVTAEWGWPVVPDDVQRAVIWIASAWEGDASNRQGGLAAKTVAEVHENYMQQQAQFEGQRGSDDLFPGKAMAVLSAYRRATL